MELVIFFLVICALLAYIAWKEYFFQQEIIKLVELSKAKTLEEVVAAEVIRKDIQDPTPPVPGAKQVSQLDPEEFDQMIKKINDG